MKRILNHRIVFVGGKGGVGKTTVAASLAMLAADNGRDCLLVSTDPAHSLGDLFDDTIGGRQKQLFPHLQALEIDPEAEIDRYLKTVKENMKSLVHPAMYAAIERQMELVREAPGSLEAALLDRVAELLMDAPGRFDLVIFDTAPTGHTIHLLSLPEVMAAWTGGLLKRHRESRHLSRLLKTLSGSRPSAYDKETEISREQRDSRIGEILEARRHKLVRAREILVDDTMTAFLLVLTPEKLPLLESKKAFDLLSKHKLRVAAIVVNRLLPAVVEGTFFETRRQLENHYRKEVDRLFPKLPKFHLPLLETDVRGAEMLREIGRTLAGQEANTEQTTQNW